MSNKPNKPIQLNPVQRPLTDEEKQARAMQFLAQKREQYAINILHGLCSNPDAVSKTIVANAKGTHTEINNGDALVTKAVEIADLLLEKLYPIKEENK